MNYCSIVSCSVGNLFNSVTVQLFFVLKFLVQLLIYSIDFCSANFLFNCFVQLAMFNFDLFNWHGRTLYSSQIKYADLVKQDISRARQSSKSNSSNKLLPTTYQLFLWDLCIQNCFLALYWRESAHLQPKPCYCPIWAGRGRQGPVWSYIRLLHTPL